MPLIRYEIRNEYSLANPELYRAAPKDDPEALLEAVAMAGLVGIVRQLGDLAEFAAEVFHDLHEEVMATAARSHELVARVQQLEAELPAVEKAQFSENYQLQFAYTQGAEWHASIYIDQNLLTQGDFPWFIRNSYEECRGPPRLFLLDKFDVAGAGACLKRYTDPSFFKTEWASTELLKAEKEKRDKKARKSKKKGRRRRNRELEGTFFTQMYRSMEYSSLNLAPGGASGIVSQCLNSQRRARFPAFGKNAVGDSTQASSSKLKPVYNGHILDSDRQGHLFPVERVPDFRNPEAIKVGVHDTEIETFQLKFARDEQYADLAMKEDSDLCEKPSLDADDDAASDTEQFVDALATIESEVETDTESKPKPDSDSYTQVGEVRRLSMSTSVNNEALQGDAFDVDIPETSDDVEQGSISSTPARINLEHLEKMKMSLSSTSLPENRLSSPLLDKNAFSEQNTLSHSSIEYKLSSYSEGKQSPSMDENGAILLEPTSLSSSINENRILSNGDSSPLYENSLALSFEENRVSSSFDENNLSSGETSISPSSVKIKVLPSSGDTFSSSFDENSGVPIVGDKIESPDRNIKSSSLVKSNHFSVLDENDAVPDFIRQTETGHISPVLEELQKTTSIDGEQDDSSTSFHLLPGPAIPLVNGDQNGKPGSLGSLASHKKVMSNELLIEVASTSSHGTARLGEEETGIVATADEELSSQSAEMNEAAPSTTDSLMYQCRVSEDEDDFDSMMQVSSTASSSSHSLACTPLIGVTGYSIDSDSELKSPVSSQLSLDSSPRSPRFSVLRSPTSPIQMPLDLVPPLELSAHNLYSKFLTPDSPTLSPMRNPAVFCSSASSSSLSSSTPPSPPHSSVVCSVDKAENSYTAQISSILSPMARQETLELPNSPTLAPMATSEAFMMHQSRKNQSLMESSNDVPVSPRSPVLMPMLNAEKLQPHTSSLSRQEESPPVPRSINHTVEKKQQLPAATSMVSNSAFLAEELSIASNRILSYAAAQEKPLALSSIAVTSPKIKRNELQPLRGSPTLQPLVTKEEELPPPPPIPPLQWCVRSDQTGLPLPASKTSEHSVRLRSSSLPTVRISEPPAPPALPMASRRFESIGGKDELIEAIASHNRSSLKKVTNQHRAPIPKTLDEREMLLEQIRTRSFSLRHTTVEKHEAPRSVTSINVAAILEKANAIRQAFVGSDDEEDDDWSDS